MPLSDPFLNFGNLDHSQEPWAVDEATMDGIEAYITTCRCREELRRIAKEARQMVCWAVEYQEKINILRRNTMTGQLNQIALHHILIIHICFC
jgi:hypothetical protein